MLSLFKRFPLAQWPIIALGVSLMLGGAYGLGRWDGHRLEKLKNERAARTEEERLNRKAAKLTHDLVTSREKNAQLQGALERAAKASATAGRVALGDDSLQRIRSAFEGDGRRAP